ncbi:hypothetical protein SHJG_0502 [Streptomyces hygroscopicus subsp. jinggangensis 5008]|nr:hypothetical protein SHJG_0502 [Streptomyces hygroscopicus subsp. jinggangensis 5008]AGF60001.1 hypothetical protein SHJGH_0335 [Streptomyces hygroscopicus subsp. jinggangensis TL01]
MGPHTGFRGGCHGVSRPYVVTAGVRGERSSSGCGASGRPGRYGASSRPRAVRCRGPVRSRGAVAPRAPHRSTDLRSSPGAGP